MDAGTESMKSKLPGMIPRSPRIWLAWGAKLALSLFLLWLSLRHLPGSALKEALLRARPSGLAASLAIYLTGVTVFELLRLAACARLVAESVVPASTWLRIFLESRAFLYLLPSGVGQEGFLWWRLRGQGWQHANCVFVVLLIRVTGLAGWLLALGWALTATPLRVPARALLPAPLAQPLAWAALGALLLLLAGLTPAVLRRRGLLARHSPGLGAWARLLPATLGSMTMVALSMQWGARAFGLEMDIGVAGGILTLLFLALVLPVSVAGLGVQEGLLLLVGKGLGWPPGATLGLSCLLHLHRAALALTGLGCLLLLGTGRWFSGPEEVPSGGDHAIGLPLGEPKP